MNNLFPVFIKQNINYLIIGGGKIALEKLQTILKNSPNAKIKIVTKTAKKDIKTLCTKKQNIKLIINPVKKKHFKNINLVIAATNNNRTNIFIRKTTKKKNILLNCADKPHLCDFYLGSVVHKKNIKIAISTNGKAPGLSKRLRLYFENIIPNNLNKIANNINIIRKKTKLDFRKKAKLVEKLTSELKV